MVSRPTPTTIRRGVPPKVMGTPKWLDRRYGSRAIPARKKAPTRVILVSARSIYSAVDFPGLIPGINPPYFLILSARSIGLVVTAV